MIESMIDTDDMSFVLSGGEEQWQPGQSELGFHEGHQQPGESFPPEGQWLGEEAFSLQEQEESLLRGTDLHHHPPHRRPMENM